MKQETLKSNVSIEHSHNHNHEYQVTKQNEKKVLVTIIFTAIAMIMEIGYGYFTNSIGLLSDGYHMATHLLALFMTYITYILNRKLKTSGKLKQDNNKISALGAYTSSLFLGITAIWIIIEAIERFITPEQIKFNEAILVLIIGLIVNAICLILMEGNFLNKDKYHCNKTSETCYDHNCHYHDYNFKAAYYHIAADILTSILAIVALFIGKYTNIQILDTITGLLGGILILKWAKGLLSNTVKILIDF